MIKLFKYLKKKECTFAAISLIFIIIQVWLDLRMPDYMSKITTLVQTSGSDMKDIIVAGLYMVLCAMGSLVATIIVGFFVAKIAAGLAMTLREIVYNKTMDFSTSEFGKFSTASLITRSTNDITQIQTFVALGLQVFVKAPIMAIWAILKIYTKSWKWTATTGIAVIILIIMIGLIMLLALPKMTIVQKLTDNLNRIARENLTGIKVIRAYNAEKYQEEKFEKANKKLTDANIFTQRALSIQQPGMKFIMSSLTLAIYWVGVYMIEQANIMDKLELFSDMVVFSSYAAQIIMAFMMLTMTFIILPRAMVSAKRINEVIYTDISVKDGSFMSDSKDYKGTIEFQSVSFKYPNAREYVLKDIDFKIKTGETLAIIGSTGSGKSTIANLIMRFYDITEGKIIVDNTDIREYKQEFLRKKIGYVSQNPIIFRGTVSSNVAYSEIGKIDFKKLENAIKISQSEEFISKMKNKYETKISQGGANISGGQKQRLSIARAIYADPEIYIFDDSFSALDYKTDLMLRNDLKEKTKGATKIIIAQRIGTIMDADQIIVLEKGKVVGKGKHKELLKSCSVYLEIAKSQLSKEEIENA